MGFKIPEKVSKYYPDYVEKMASQAGKTFVVTGTTTGTGFYLVSAVLSKSGRVLALNRPSERVTKARESILQKIPDADLTDVSCDLQSLESVSKAAAEVLKLCEESGIDHLVCNAGIMALPDTVTQDSFPIEMQTNHLSSFLLAKTLFPAIQKAAIEKGSARITTHSSAMRHYVKKVDPAHYKKCEAGSLGGDRAMWVRYSQTKLANQCFVLALKDKLEERGIQNILCTFAAPGFAATHLQASTAKVGGGFSFQQQMMVFAQSAEDGSLPLLKATISEDAKSGDFYHPGKKGIFSWILQDGVVGPPVKKDISKEAGSKAENKAACWEASEAAIGPFFDTK